MRTFRIYYLHAKDVKPRSVVIEAINKNYAVLEIRRMFSPNWIKIVRVDKL